MCGRYASFTDAQDLADEFAIARVADDARLLPPSWNLAPTDPVRIVVERAARGTGEVERTLRVARWGLVPGWAKDPSVGTRMINARAETLVDKPAFAKPLAVRRCLLPADGYYEWMRLPAPDGSAGSARTRKQPYYLTGEGGRPVALAGLYEFWRDRSRADDDPDRWLVSATVVTTDASPDLARIHDRMPVVLPAGTWDAWLDPARGRDEALEVLRAGSVTMRARPVGGAVGSVANDGPGLVEEVQPQE
ncbi:SOS response-associated peptidase [Cellulomonas sp. PhB143]|uniref:SOS response-associated peptidase n=1 Tax=Cellulomonas sp. PhB143 TaxID=2485186 RepID=UPI000F467CE7|nr:SOS response-associated peptidase [Cellulomonas sp. PhB143]ROS76980.1 putative SOS response-associated peptidase YedK [Cellulomonas sp. PhB143]